MADSDGTVDPAPGTKAGWAELFCDGHGIYTVLLNLGIGLHALDIFVITTVMPAVIADIGGLSFYTWTTMLYMVGSLVGAASAGYLRVVSGRRRGYVIGGWVLLVGTIGCAIPPDMFWLLAARAVKGFGGGLVIAQSMALVSELYDQRTRTRIIAMITTTWSIAALLGPTIGGAFAEIGWWRGAFWATAPLALLFTWLAWRAVPESDLETSDRRLPLLRLATLTLGVMCVGVTSQIEEMGLNIVLLVVAVAVVWFTFRLDERSEHGLFPTRPMSFTTPVGTAYWTYFLISVSHTGLLIFTPLFLQELHGVSPLYVGYMSLVFSLAWTAGSLGVSGLTGMWERVAPASGLALTAIGTALMAAIIVDGSLMLITFYIIITGFGIGVTNVVMTAWGMSVARPGEESVTASSMPTIRSLGVAFGAAGAGLVANGAGLGHGTEPDAATVATVAPWVLGAAVLPPALGAVMSLSAMFHHHGAAESGRS